MVDPNILTTKAIFAAFIAAQVASHIWIFPKLPKHMRCDGLPDRVIHSMMVLIASMLGLVGLFILYWFFFVWS